jgi:hypothetical protein
VVVVALGVLTGTVGAVVAEGRSGVVDALGEAGWLPPLQAAESSRRGSARRARGTGIW